LAIEAGLYASPVVKCESADSELSRMNILVADDSDMMLGLVRDICEDLGHSVVSTKSAEEALLEAEKVVFDLVFSDLHMLAMDGFAFAQALRGKEDYFATPFILLTGDSSPEFSQKCRESGVTSWIKKPFDVKDLQAMLRRFADV
jgi:two-component system, NarL family, capsular synthesis sensor histidine kinase RcsC